MLPSKPAAGAERVSNAPMSELSPPGAGEIVAKSDGRTAPRWSELKPKLLPLSIAGERFELKAWVGVVPAFTASGASIGFMGELAVPVWSAAAVKPVDDPILPIRLYPPELNVPNVSLLP